MGGLVDEGFVREKDGSVEIELYTRALNGEGDDLTGGCHRETRRDRGNESTFDFSVPDTECVEMWGHGSILFTVP